MSVAQLDKPNTSAPGQYLGYGLQDLRLCYYLLFVADGFSVSLEYLDDVAIHDPTGHLILEQSKSALTHNPVGDRANDLWKTLANWADLCVEDRIDPQKTSFRLYVTPAKVGKIVSKLHSAADFDSATELIDQIVKLRSKGKTDAAVVGHISRFLAAGLDICVLIIKNFSLINENDPLEAIRERLRPLLSNEVIDQFAAVAIGQAKSRIDRLIRLKQGAVIQSSEFRSDFQAFIRKHNLTNLLRPTTASPSPSEIDDLLSQSPLFVQQLSAIKCSKELMVSAISDFLRTTADKINWAANGDIFEDSLDELDSALLRHHAIQWDEVSDILADKDGPKVGRALYRKCISVQMPLEGQSLPQHFIPGAYNCLADALRLGWHPNYKTLFQED